LDNGLRVVMDASPHAPAVAIQAWVEVGSADEVGREAGLAHVHEHMLFKGTTNRPVGAISRDVEAAGGVIGAFTSFDHTVFHLSLPSRSADIGIGIIADVLQNASFEEGELEREKQVILEELLQGRNDPMRRVSQALFDTAYEEHPYRLPVIGTEASVLGVDRALVHGFFKKWYGADRVVLGIGGDVDEDEVLRQVEREFGGMSRSTGVRSRLVEPAQTSFRSKSFATPFQHTLVSLGFPIAAHTNEDMPLLDLLGIVLGQGESCRLSLRMMREPGVLLGGSASCFKGIDPGMFTFLGACNANQVSGAIEMCFSELQGLFSQGISSEELERAKMFVLSGRVYEQDAIEGIVGKRAFFESVYRDVDAEALYFETIANAQVEDVFRVCEETFVFDRANVVVGLEEGGEFDGDAAELASVLQGRTAGHTVNLSSPHVEALEEKTSIEMIGAKETEGNRFWTLSSGTRVILQADDSVPMCGIQAIIPGGLRAETHSNSGVTALLSETILQGTPSRSAVDIAKEVEGAAGHLSGFVRLNSFGIGGVCLKAALPQTLDVLFDVFRNASYPEDAVNRERSLQLEGIRGLPDDPCGLTMQRFREAMYGDHPYGFHLLGTPDVVTGLTPSSLREWHTRHIRPSALTLSFCGDVNAQWLNDVLEASQEGWSNTVASAGNPDEQSEYISMSGPRRVEGQGQGEQTHLALGYPGTTIHAEDREGVMVLSSILGGQSGRLFHALRERRSLGYVVSFQSLEGIDPGYLVGYVATHPEKESLALEVLRDELTRMREELPGEAEFLRVRNSILGSYEMGLQSRLSRAAEAGFAEAYGMGWESFRGFSERLVQVTREDVLRLAQSYLDPDKEVLSIVRPAGV